MNTSTKVGDIREILHQLYSQVSYILLTTVIATHGMYKHTLRLSSDFLSLVSSGQLLKPCSILGLPFLIPLSWEHFTLQPHSHILNEELPLCSVFCSQIYVEYVVRNPMCKLDQAIKSDLFKEQLEEFVKALPFYQGT